MKIKVDKMPEEKEECLFCYEDHDICGVYVTPGILCCTILKSECDLKDGQCSCCTMLKEQGMNTDETTLVIITELFDDEDKPREVLACKKCGQAYKTRHDVINFCSNCGRKIIGEKPLLNKKVKE